MGWLEDYARGLNGGWGMTPGAIAGRAEREAAERNANSGWSPRRDPNDLPPPPRKGNALGTIAGLLAIGAIIMYSGKSSSPQRVDPDQYRAPDHVEFVPQPAPAPAPPPEPVVPYPVLPSPAAIIDVTSVMGYADGVHPEDTPEEVAAVYAPVTLTVNPAYPEYAFGKYEGRLQVTYQSNRARFVSIFGRPPVSSGQMNLGDLLGRTEEEAVAIIRGSPFPPVRVLENKAFEFELCWYLPNYPGSPEGPTCPTSRTLEVGFTRAAADVPRVSTVYVNWGTP